jgi:hypothetical protein
MNGVDVSYASPEFRDGFLSALDRGDGVTLVRLARDMTGCGNPLPSTICTQLGIPVGSTYGFAARRIVACGTEEWLPTSATVVPAEPARSTDAIAAADAVAAK